MRITVTNNGTSTLTISSMRLEGQVLALPLFSYDTAVDLVVPPSATKSLSFPFSVSGVGSQATGLVVSTLSLYGPSGAVVASQPLVANVHGSLHSIYGLFGLAVLASPRPRSGWRCWQWPDTRCPRIDGFEVSGSSSPDSESASC